MGGAATHPENLTQHERRRNQFPKGSSVEVRTKEEDFKGVYFSATVISSKTLSPKKGSRKNLKKLYVEYRDLLASENGSDRLRECVDVSCVRPEPPFQEIVKGFEAGDVVDAFYKDGWWIGVVKLVVEGRERFVVTFQHPPDELEFGLADLRAHWDWVNGRWVQPGNKSKAGLMFDAGRKVEVSFDGEDRKDAWFPAIIYKDVGNGAFLVEYASENNDNKAQPVKVTVDSLHLRPCPPLLKDKNFVLFDKVDAFFDSGWWSGTIIKQLENSRYSVSFKEMKREKGFHQSELRPHMEWKDGKWFASQLSQEGPNPYSDDAIQEHHTPENSSASAATVPVSNSGDGKDTSDGKTLSSLTSMKGHFDQVTLDNQNSSQLAASLTKRRQHLSYSRNALCKPQKKLKEGNALEASEEDTQDRSIKEILAGSVSPVSVNNVAISATQTATGDQSSDNPSWGKRNQRKRRTLDATRNVGEKINSTSSSMKKSSTQMLQLETPGADVRGKESDAVRNTAEDVQNEHSKEETELPIVIGLPCAGMLVKRGRPPKSKETRDLVEDQKQQLNDSIIQKTKDSKQLEIVEVSLKRKRGRPRKIQIESIRNTVQGNAQRFVGSDDLNKKVGDPQRSPEVTVIGIEAATPNQGKMSYNKYKLTNDQSGPKNRKGSMMKGTIAKMHDKNVVRESTRLRESRSLKKGRRWITGEKIDRGVQDSRDASRGKMTEINRTVDVEKVVGESSNNGLDDEPLSKWIEEMHSPSVIDGSRFSPVSTVEQWTTNGEKRRDAIVLEEESGGQPENRMQACSSVDKLSIVPSVRTLPFVKNTVLWKTIESMDVFQRIPQSPHFQPLEQFKESSREGLAIGYMVTFSSLVEKTSKLQLSDPKSITDDILETLADLERHGFDVRVVRDRVNEFLAVKNKQEKLVGKTNEINIRILKHNQVKNRIEEEILEINKEIKKFQEKLLLAESAKENEDVEIESLRAKLRETEESIKNVRLDFGGIAPTSLDI